MTRSLELAVVSVTLTESTQIAANISSWLDSSSCDDIYISHNIPWETLAGEGKLADLTSMYATTVYTDTNAEAGNQAVTFADRITSSSLRTAKLGDYYYKVPYVSGAGGIAYNVTMFEQNGWDIPETYEELVTLCATINAANISCGIGQTVKPFIWSGTDEYLWDCVVFDWWAQLAGVEENDSNSNSINKFNKYLSSSQFNPDTSPELKNAWAAWYDLIANKPENYVSGSTGLNHMDSQMAFAQGKAAMIPAACWLESEVGEENLITLSTEIALMPTPFLADAKKDANNKPIRVNYDLAAADSIVVSQKGNNTAVAKEFLLFMSELDHSKVFPELAGGALFAMKYNFGELKLMANSKWKLSMYEIVESSIRFNRYSSNPMYIKGLVQPYVNGYQYLTVAGAPASYTPTVVFNNAYNYARNNWNNWRQQAGL